MLTSRGLPRNSTDEEGFGIYVHYPYCLAKCPYCDFTSYASERGAAPQGSYTSDVLRELELRAPRFAGRRLDSVFFGGGTPSLWAPAEIGRVLSAALAAFPRRAPDVEVTIECNPTSFDEDRARALREAGVSRVSIGVQSLDARRLAFLGRLHGPEAGPRAIEQARRAGFERVSGDLLFGVAGGAAQGPLDAAREVLRVADAGATHVSAYALTIEPGTRFGELARRGELPLTDDDGVADAFEAVERALGARGLEHYEISSYARPGDESRHNLGYWRGRDYLGVGVSAVGTVATGGGRAERWRNARQPARWSDGVRAGVFDEEVEELGPEERLRERIMLGLRLAEGVDLDAAEAALGVEPLPAARRRELDRLLTAGRVERVGEGRRFRVARSSWTLADGIAASLF
jgi:oxygen-independent coproporphyrinogen-3 oxidase